MFACQTPQLSDTVAFVHSLSNTPPLPTSLHCPTGSPYSPSSAAGRSYIPVAAVAGSQRPFGAGGTWIAGEQLTPAAALPPGPLLLSDGHGRAGGGGERRVLSAAKARGVRYVQAFANSPPYWMTVSGSVTGSKSGATDLL